MLEMVTGIFTQAPVRPLWQNKKVDPGFMVKNESLHVPLKGPEAFWVLYAPVKNLSPFELGNVWMHQ